MPVCENCRKEINGDPYKIKIEIGDKIKEEHLFCNQFCADEYFYVYGFGDEKED